MRSNDLELPLSVISHLGPEIPAISSRGVALVRFRDWCGAKVHWPL